MAFEGGGFSRSSSSRGAAGGAASYQNAAAGEGSAWASVVTQVEDELRRFTALSAQLKKSVDLVGSARDSEEVRQRIAAALARGKESVDGISALLRTKLAEAAGKEEAGLSAKDRAARKTQQQRFEKDWLTVSSAYKDVRAGAAESVARRLLPPLPARLPALFWPSLFTLPRSFPPPFLCGRPLGSGRRSPENTPPPPRLAARAARAAASKSTPAWAPRPPPAPRQRRRRRALRGAALAEARCPPLPLSPPTLALTRLPAPRTLPRTLTPPWQPQAAAGEL
jgi:hypothetical protein